ncbi:MAG: hypothetical protein ABF271_12825 [Abyssibacter sp.]|uniref:hypothetical protein n=1 Tax=Abyssibacter sp. TaxID=2320200 RepID=UPI00321A8430
MTSTLTREWRVCHDEIGNRFSVESFGLVTRDISVIAMIGGDDLHDQRARFSADRGEVNQEQRDAELIAAAGNSYRRNAKDPAQAAKDDLLHEAIVALQVQIRSTANFARCSVESATTNAAKSVLAKACEDLLLVEPEHE